jgi:hypothetical protein
MIPPKALAMLPPTQMVWVVGVAEATGSGTTIAGTATVVNVPQNEFDGKVITQ